MHSKANQKHKICQNWKPQKKTLKKKRTPPRVRCACATEGQRSRRVYNHLLPLPGGRFLEHEHRFQLPSLSSDHAGVRNPFCVNDNNKNELKKFWNAIFLPHFASWLGGVPAWEIFVFAVHVLWSFIEKNTCLFSLNSEGRRSSQPPDPGSGFHEQVGELMPLRSRREGLRPLT